MTIYPDCDMNRWETSNSDGCVLANADNYYTKAQVDKRFDGFSGVTIEDVEEIVDEAVSGKVDASSLAEVATSGDYDDLTNKPTIPTVPTDVSAFNNDAGYITEDALDGYATEEWVSGYTYDKDTIDQKVSGGTFDPTQYYTTAQTDSLLDEKLDASAYTPTDLSDYYTKEETNAQISSATSGKADASAVTAEISAAVSGKVDTSTYTAYTASTDTAIGNKADASAFTAHTADTTIHVTSSEKETWNAKANVSDIPSVSGYADSVKYNSTSKYVEFYHGGTGGTKVFEYDASPFLIDGMVQNVEIKDVTLSGQSVTCLVVSFNTDAGKQDINIPISEIFNASNYYTKSEVDSAMSGKVSTSDFTAFTASTDTALGNKQDTSGMTAYTEVTAFTAHTANTNIHVTSEEKSTWNAKSNFSGSYNDLTDKPTIPTSASQLTNDAGYATSGYVDSAVSGKADSSAVTAEISAAVSGKQDTLVSGTNIKTINNESILGSGNITIQGGGGNNTVELTQAEYDALVSAGTVSADTYYIITDAQAPTIVSSVTSASTDSEIPTAKAVWDATQNGGGGGGTVDSGITSGSSNAVASSAIWSATTYNKDVEIQFNSNGRSINLPSGCTSIKVEVGEFHGAFISFYSGNMPLGNYNITNHGSLDVYSSFNDSTYTTSGNTVIISWQSSSNVTELSVGDVSEQTINAVVAGAWVSDNTYMKSEVDAKVATLQSSINGKLDSTAYTPTVVDSGLTVDSTNPVQNKALYGELRMTTGKEPDVQVAFTGLYSNNFPSGCTKIEVTVSNGQSVNVEFYNSNDDRVGYYSMYYFGTLDVHNNFSNSSYSVSGSVVTITWSSSVAVAKLRVDDTSVSITAIGSDIVTSVKDAFGGLRLVKITAADYAQITPDENTVYFIGDSNGYIMKLGSVSIN